METLWAKGQKDEAWQYYKDVHGKTYEEEEVSLLRHMH
jgi:hypothetical protein